MSVRLVDNKDILKKVNDWRDPLYLNNLLTDKEKLIHKKAKDFCKTRLLPTVIDDNNKSFFDKKIYSDLGKNGFLGNTINTPSMLCIEDVLNALIWVEKIGGLKRTIELSEKKKLTC